MSGTITGAAKLLHVSAPGISRLIKHTENSVGINLFDRVGRSFVPNPSAKRIFDEINEIFTKIEILNDAVAQHKSGRGSSISLAATPSIAQIIAPRVTALFCQKYPDMFVDLDILKIGEWVDYILLEKGEFVICSHEFKHEGMDSIPIAVGEQIVIVPSDHRFAEKRQLSVMELMGEKLIGVSPSDPYGAIISQPFVENGLDYNLSIRTRFAHSVLTLVDQGLGVAVIDEFSVAGSDFPNVVRIKLTESVPIRLYILQKKNKKLSAHSKYAIQCFRKELKDATRNRAWEKP